jgi:hypothetical protein
VLYWVATCTPTTWCNDYIVHGYVIYKPRKLGEGNSNLAPINYSLGPRFIDAGNFINVSKNVDGITKSITGTTLWCCSIECQDTSTTPIGIASVTQTIVTSANCYPGSPEIENVICSRGIFTGVTSTWGPTGVNGVGHTIATSGTCPQGAN